MSSSRRSRSRRPLMQAVCRFTIAAFCSVPLLAHAQAPEKSSTDQTVSWASAKSVLDGRCVVCHSCYNAPCQLILSSFEGTDRGATKQIVYDGDRLTAVEPTRLFVDEETTAGWRQREFFSVRESVAENSASVMLQMLQLGRANPLPTDKKLPKSIDTDINRKMTCPDSTEFAHYVEENPHGGMPFAAAPLTDAEYRTLTIWLAEGANGPDNPPVQARRTKSAVDKWETFFNGSSAKQRTTSRYLYEHLFLAHLYLPEEAPGTYFRLVRSRTPNGKPIDEIATARPYDDPGAAPFYYRLRPIHSTIVYKTHMIYALTPAKMKRYQELFLESTWVSEEVPSYDPVASANPFVTFENVPARARYQFMLDNAHYIIMTFIRGPVCRGQIALNVIDDQFWVVFVDPDADLSVTDPEYLNKAKKWLRLPAENKSDYKPGTLWVKYLADWQKYTEFREKAYRKADPQKKGPAMSSIWDGDGTNDNAMLTVFRHFDSASVVTGFVGAVPKTAWVVDFPILERIYYDLVAGFNVYGNVVHQLSTRLYMDYLRMESEDVFISYLPADLRDEIRDSWYEGARAQVKLFFENRLGNLDIGTQITFETDDPKREMLLDIYTAMTPEVRGAPDPINRCENLPCFRAGTGKQAERADSALETIASRKGEFVVYTPDVSFLRIRVGDSGDDDLVYTLIHNKAHYNVAFMFGEKHRREPKDDTMSIVPGFVGNYPNFFFDVQLEDIELFADRLSTVDSDETFQDLVDDFGVRRTSPLFWPDNDWFTARFAKTNPYESGLFDLNRYMDF